MFKGLDKWLIGIVALVAVVVVVSLVLLLTRSEPQYLAEDTPESIVHNYLLAIQREEYDRALTYLSPSLPGLPPGSREMRESLTRSADELSRSSFTVRPAQPEDGGTLLVEVSVTSYEGEGIIGSSQQTRSYRLWLQEEGGTWKLIDGNGFWGWSWDRQDTYISPFGGHL